MHLLMLIFQSSPYLERVCENAIRNGPVCECLRYAIHKASGMSETAEGHPYGFQNTKKRSVRVERAIYETQQTQETIAR